MMEHVVKRHRLTLFAKLEAKLDTIPTTGPFKQVKSLSLLISLE